MPIEEKDLRAYLEERLAESGQVSAMSQQCPSCGARVSYASPKTHCSFCHSPLPSAETDSAFIKPTAFLPVEIDRNGAKVAFQNWLKKRWFKPRDLNPRNLIMEDLEGLYLPFWMYDIDVVTDYRGQRGDQHWHTETYATQENGQTVTKTRQVSKTIWIPVSGRVQQAFNDILVFASSSVLQKEILKLEPWALHKLIPFEEEQKHRFSFETYQLDVVQGLEQAKKQIEPAINDAIRRDIGGYQHMINSKQMSFKEVNFKHILLPVYVCAYEFSGKTYRFVINAQTGEVQGKRPWSWLKIGMLIAGTVAVILTLIKLGTA